MASIIASSFGGHSAFERFRIDNLSAEEEGSDRLVVIGGSAVWNHAASTLDLLA